MRLLLMTALLYCTSALAQSEADNIRMSTTWLKSTQAEAGLGMELRPIVQRAARESRNGGNDSARALLLDVARQCDAYRAAPDRHVVSFRSQRQYELYLDAHSDGRPIDWLDMACGDAYKQLGYLAVENRDYPQALQWLDKAQATAPYEPEMLTERGAALNLSKNWKAALESYQQALDLIGSHPEAAYAEALALRGKGFALIELGDLDAARDAYESSLKLEPGNRNAERELTYIKQQQARLDKP
jgi:Flp pilus assembly protein TadD